MLPEYPWGSRRDELAVLEEDFDDLCRAHEERESGPGFEAEEAVVREQADTEDASEAELTAKIGPGWLEESEDCPHHDGHEHEPADATAHGPDMPVLEFLRRDLEREPTYERALAWAGPAFRFAKAAYAKERHPQLLRVCLNACLVPMKVSYALNELAHEDAYSLDVADKELELAQAYLSRATASLESLRAAGRLPAEQEGLIALAAPVAEAVTEARSRIARERKRRQDTPLI
ncbi:hypothetical protein EPO34_01535 [Patescibacteria group bacterium]|nr:MAG: hypothetical protein EPO34_01535 [Patescibacteria group bacterium]